MKFGSLLPVLIGLLLAACAPVPAPTLQGTDLEKTPAPDFQLSDSSGKPFKLSDQKGNVVVLTFLYANCPDECPLIAEKVRETSQRLGTDAADVRFVAVSVDPEHDTPDAVQKFLKAHQVDGILTYLVGARTDLAPVWKAYFLSVLLSSDPNILNHQTRVIVIDRGGLQRSNFRSDLDPAALANDIRIALSG